MKKLSPRRGAAQQIISEAGASFYRREDIIIIILNYHYLHRHVQWHFLVGYFTSMISV